MNRLTPARLSMVMFMVVGGLIAAYIAKGLLATEEKKAAAPPLRNIPMAVAELPAGTLITEAHLGVGPVLPSKMTRDVLLSNKSIVGRVTKEAIPAAEPGEPPGEPSSPVVGDFGEPSRIAIVARLPRAIVTTAIHTNDGPPHPPRRRPPRTLCAREAALIGRA